MPMRAALLIGYLVHCSYRVTCVLVAAPPPSPPLPLLHQLAVQVQRSQQELRELHLAAAFDTLKSIVVAAAKQQQQQQQQQQQGAGAGTGDGSAAAGSRATGG